MPNIDLAGIACPDRATLVRLLRGLLTEDETSRLERHLDECPPCCQAVRALDVSDALLDAMRGADAVHGLPDDETVRGLINRLKALRLPMPQRASGDTLTLVGDFTETDALGLQELLDPPEAEGELGRLAGYRVLRVLGAGGMGVVLAAEDPRLLRRVAIKMMDGRLAAHEDYRLRFLREARAAAAIEHPHIVAVHQVGEHRGFPFLAMQLLEGESLEQRVARAGRLPLAECLRIGRETAEALAAAHRRGLIHRDVKPANIWLQSPGGVVKLLDFGLAHFVENEARMTQTGLVLGTPSYMSPEQARGEVAGLPSDLFSLGAVLYRMTTGREPFGGANTLAVLTALAIEPPTPPHELNAAIPPAFSDLIVRLLAKRPVDRPASAEAVADQLRAIAAGEADPKVQQAAPGSRQRTWSWLLVTASLLLAAVAIFRSHWIDLGMHGGSAVPNETVLPPAPADEQAVAEWVLRIGGELDGRTRGIENLRRVSFPIHWITLDGKAVDDDCLTRLLPCRDLQGLSLVNTSISRSGLRQLVALPKLGHLSLSNNPQITDHDLDELARIRTLLTVDLNQTNVTTAGLMRLARLPWLGSISVRDMASLPADITPPPTEIAVGDNSRFLNLTNLDLSDATITDAGLVQLKPMTGLLSLNLTGTKATAAGIAELQQTLGDCWVTAPEGRVLAPPTPPGDPDRRAAVRFLKIGFTVTIADPQQRQIEAAAELPAGPFRLVWVGPGPTCTDADLELLSSCRQLMVLHLWGSTPITPAGLSHLRQLRRLGHLNLNGLPHLGDDALPMLSTFAALRTVAFNGDPITDDGLRRLPDLPELEYLDLRGTRVTGSGLKYLHKVPNLRQLLLAGNMLGDAALMHLADLTELEDLDLGGTGISGAALVHLKRLPHLRRLWLSRTQVKDTDVGLLTEFKEIRQLGLDGTAVGDRGVGQLTALTDLEWLNLTDTPVTAAGLRSLKTLPRLGTLFVGGSGGSIDDEAMAAVAELPQLEKLEVVSTRVTEAGLACLHGQKLLKTLVLRGAAVTEQGIADLKLALPDCSVTQ